MGGGVRRKCYGLDILVLESRGGEVWGGGGSWICLLARMRKRCCCYLPCLLADLLWWIWAFEWLVAGFKEMEKYDAT